MDLDNCWSNISNPTSLNARRQLNRLFESLPRDSPIIAELHVALSQNALLPTLSRFMLRPSLTITITWAFRPLLMDLCARWLDSDEDVWAKLVALGLLIEIHEELFPILSSFLRRFERGPLRALLRVQALQEIDRTLLHQALLAYYRILRATPSLPKNLNWDLACLMNLCANRGIDRGARWLAIRCYSLQSDMSEKLRLRMEQDALGELFSEDCPIVYSEEITGVVKEVDGWLLPVLEDRRIRDYRDSLLDSPDYFAGSEESDIVLNEADLSPRIANIHGILLLRTPSSKPVSSSLVFTSSALLTLRQVAVNISLRRPTLLTSTPSAGKATFLNHLSHIIYPSSPNQVIAIHLADTSLDPRSLLGSYVSSTTSAGTFEWKDGVLVKAMREGRWVVLKDIDRASNEVLGLISPLAESMDDVRPIGSNATLSLGNRGTVEAVESFALFATRSAEASGALEFPPPTFLGAQKWQEIVVPENSMDDLRLIVDSKFPSIAGPVSDSLIDIWLAVKRLRVVSSSRPVGIRDLEKFCSRVSYLLDSTRITYARQRQPGEVLPSMVSLFPHPSVREEIYLDARDVFFAAGASSKPASEQREAIAAVVGERLGLSTETCEWVLKQRTPAFEIEKDVDGRPVTVRVGRTSLSVNSVNCLTDPAPARPFSMHKQALRLISQIAASVAAIEPVLLTGETGTGKTSVISHLASLLNRPLISLNLSNQTESSDLIGGFRPVSARIPALELQRRFMKLFQKTFSSKKNEHLLQSLRKAIMNGKWKVAVKLWSETTKTALDKLKKRDSNGDILRPDETIEVMDSPTPRKKRKVHGAKSRSSFSEWTAFEADVRLFEVQHVLDKDKFSFRYVEGPLVKAIRTGAWVLLDEINLASPETLECIAGLLQGPTSSVTLTEQGSLDPVPRHSEFRLFACMNPATDVGKKDLPTNIRAKFTEIEVPPPDDDPEALVSVISHYIGHLAVTDKAIISDIAEFYTNVKQLAAAGKIADGSNHRPHYSMRSLSRALTFAADTVQSFGLRRALWEGFTMTFTMVLDQASTDIVLDIGQRTLLLSVKNKMRFLNSRPTHPQDGQTDLHVQIGPFWLSSGPCDRDEASDYILTPSVQKKLVDLARIVTTGRYPVLIEGPTSSGKTSAIHYLARRTGHNFVRINNHEHTDIQEYLGSYVSDAKTGKLVFRDGLLVRALRRGDWIVLDELNLAPTDVLEALNRLLDDNRELVIPETQEVVKPHPEFMLFATQNPSGVYAGRKVLSRAFRNRFLEVHFEDVPAAELEHILSQRSRIAPSYSQHIVAVFRELQKRRQLGRIFEGKEGFATLRDLFRWAGRDAQGYQELAENGYMLLAERTRRDEDKLVVKEVIEKVMNVSISESSLYNLDRLGRAERSGGNIVWTKSMQRLFILLSSALRHNEPVLLVGETGSGKTSVCQIYAEIENKLLRSVNCHQNTEAADIIGGLRPVRQDSSFERKVVQEAAEVLGLSVDPDYADKAQFVQNIASRLEQGNWNSYEREVLVRAQDILSPNRGLLTWRDGPLVASMRFGDVFLLDEISLADDSVLERLNSVLEPTRTLVLAEKGGEAVDEFEIVANAGFKFVATMNPGGDFGKKELSPALRNRFTEIWVPSVMKHDEISEILKQSWRCNDLAQLTEPILDFVDWMMEEVKDNSIITLRDILSWVDFCNTLSQITSLPPGVLFMQGGEMTLLDGLYSMTQLSGWTAESLKALRQRAVHRLKELCPNNVADISMQSLEISMENGKFSIGLFSIPNGPRSPQLDTFSLKAPTSLENAFRLIRACQVTKPILLEGSPGVGKTSLVMALAAAAGQNLCRINLSEQTDLVDLFGSDLPSEGHASASFNWNDAAFLRALKNGDWILLDEMNLASQSVLEGLNAVFDHRGSVYVPELDRTFARHPNFRVLAAQNPLNQGSGRKGLPKSFLNRFTKVYIQHLSPADMLLICQHLFPAIRGPVLQQMITFNCRLEEEVVIKRRFGTSGAPWEFNLRDLLRWGSLMTSSEGTIREPWEYVNVVYGTRFRTAGDTAALFALFADVFHDANIAMKVQPRLVQMPGSLVCGSSQLSTGLTPGNSKGCLLLPTHLDRAESAVSSLSRNWLVVVTGPHSSGKTSFARALASISGRPLEELSLGSSSDTSDLIGSFEQTSADFSTNHLLENLLRIIGTSGARVHLDNTGTLSLACRLKDEIIAALQTHSLESLQELARSTLDLPLSISLDAELRQGLETISTFPTDDKDAHPTFKWIDGPLIKAMRLGQWLLLDNANLCSPSVLDRLNSLCETNGYIVLTEKGVEQEIVYPHPDFRLIMTVDTSRGEISRAMRNRGIEIALKSSVQELDSNFLFDAKRQVGYADTRNKSELLRRAVHVPMPQSHDCLFTSVIRSNSKDTITPKLKEVEVLHKHFGSSYDTAVVVFVLSGSSSCSFKGMLRLYRSLGCTHTASLLEQTDLYPLRSVLSEVSDPFGEPDGIHMPLHPFFFHPRVHWLPDSDRKSWLLISLILEATVLSANLEITLRKQSRKGFSSDPVQLLVSKEHEHAVHFIEAVPRLVRKALLEKWTNRENPLPDLEIILEVIHYAKHLHEAASQAVANFSALYAISVWIHRCSNSAPHVFGGLQEQARELHKAYSLSSGQNVGEIWASLYRPGISQRASDLLNHLDMLPLGMQKSVVDLIAVSTANHASAGDLAKYIHMIEHRQGEALGESSGDEQLVRLSTLPESYTAGLESELSELARISPFFHVSNFNGLIRWLGKSVAFVQNAPRFIAYQLLLWRMDAGQDIIPELVDAHLQWHNALWRHSEHSQMQGPATLYTPTLLRSAITSSIASGTLKDISPKYALLKVHVDQLLSERFRYRTRENCVLAFLLRNIELVLRACFPNPEEDLIQRPPAPDYCLDILDLAELLQRPVYESFGALRLALDEILQSTSWSGRTHAVGKCWVVLSRILLSLYVPNLSVDPLRIQHCRELVQRSRNLWIQSQLDVYSFWERWKTGHHDNVFTTLLRDRLQQLKGASCRSMGHAIIRQSDFSVLQAFWTEIRCFLSGVMSAERIDRFIDATLEGNDTVLDQESLLQSAVSNFVRRMKNVYSDLQDLLRPIELAMVQLRFGLSTLRHSSVIRSVSTISSWMGEIAMFPSVRAKSAVSLLKPEDLVRSGVPLDEALLSLLLAIPHPSAGESERRQTLIEIERAYAHIMAVWDIDLADKAEKARQSESLYRNKQVTHKSTHDESEDEEIARLFPIFSEDDGEESSSSRAEEHTQPISPVALSGRFPRMLLRAHLLLFGGKSERPWKEYSTLWRPSRMQIVSCWMDGPLESLSCNVDDDSFSFRLGLLRDAKSRFQRNERSDAYSFYRDANLPEARKAEIAVKDLKKKLSELILAWPDQLVLRHLWDHCDNILSMNMNSPVAKLLGAIERLLLHTEDWEVYANRENSLFSQRQSLTDLIVAWRRLELDGWKSILDWEAHSFCEEMSEWWFRLYDTMVRGPKAAYQDLSGSALDDYLDSMTPLVEDFVTSSPLGQFDLRLKLIQSFACMASRFASANVYCQEAMSRVSHILFSVHCFYGQFSDKISAFLADRRAFIEKEIRNLVKLASWRDVNVHALQQCAQKTHRQLYKRIRAFKELLRQPVAGQLELGDSRSDQVTNADQNGVALTDTFGQPGITGGPPRLAKFVSVLSTALEDVLHPFSASAAEELSTTIITTENDYATLAPPKNVSADYRKKWNSSLLVRKRRSWYDFLKELKRIGLSPNVKSEILQRHRNTRNMMEHPRIDMLEGTLASHQLKKIDYYFYRSIVVLRDLLQCEASHHLDITTRELQRGMSSFESAFSFATSARTCLSDLTGKYISLSIVHQRLRGLARSPATCIRASAIEIPLQDLELKITEAMEALNELVDVSAGIVDLSEDPASINSESLVGVREWISRGIEMSGDLSGLLQALRVSHFITQDDRDFIRSCMNHLEGIKPLLADVSGREPGLKRFCDSICDWYDQRLVQTDALYGALDARAQGTTAVVDINTVINPLLVIGQDLSEISSSTKESSDDGSNHIYRQYTMILQVFRALRIGTVLERSQQLSENFNGASAMAISKALSQLLPFFDAYIAFVERYLFGYSAWTRSLLKLTYVSGSLVRNIARNGFCKPPEVEEDAEGVGEGAVEAAEGTGLGEGEGKDDVSNQIEDKSQFEGIRGQDDEASGQHKEHGNDGAIDVDFDLSGDLEDGPEQDTLSGDEENPTGDFSDEFDQNGLDDLKPVDDDFWNEPTEDDGTNNMRDGEAKDGRAEMAAREQEYSGKEAAKEAHEEQDRVNEDEDEDAMDIDERNVEDKGADQIQEEEFTTEMDELADYAQSNDVSGETSQPEGPEDAFDDVENLSVDEEVEGSEKASTEEQPEMTENEGEGNKSKDAVAGEARDEADEQAEGGVASKADVHAGDEGGGSANLGIADTSREELARELIDIRPNLSPPAGLEEQSTSAGLSAQTADRDEGGLGSQPDPKLGSRGVELGQKSAAASEAPLPNPHRNLGDALREVKRRFDEIMQATGAESRPPAPENATTGQTALEYIAGNTEDIDMQALGPAMGEETAKLNKLSLVEEDNEPHAAGSPEATNWPEEEGQELPCRPHRDQNDGEGKLPSQENPKQYKERDFLTMDVDDERQGLGDVPDLLPDEHGELSQTEKVEIELNRWLHEGQPEGDAQRIWQLYDALTQTLSFSLCEQLRLILEPTRATRLMGDFRTGKRLNMKKIIPYIASNYTKDKIWLRRVRPSQREYQVLIALDDSRSMAESRSIHLAFQTLALVSKAMNRLEVGNVAIASFGERMRMVHGFEDGPFTDQAGTQVLETFKFAQTATDVRSLLESSVDILTKAREHRASSSSSDLWQLEIIISDGICQDHEELRAIIRKAEEEHILVVFIVMDARGGSAIEDSSRDASRSQNSIVNMTQAMYQTVNGRLELHMQRYLDSFPFEFFVILGNVETLPDVLADTLRQFFERISAS